MDRGVVGIGCRDKLAEGIGRIALTIRAVDVAGNMMERILLAKEQTLGNPRILAGAIGVGILGHHVGVLFGVARIRVPSSRWTTWVIESISFVVGLKSYFVTRPNSSV